MTRLHVRYDRDHFPEDLRFQETGDRNNFQGRYVLQHAWTGKSQCQAAEQYRTRLPGRYEKEAQTLANLTGWAIDEIRGWTGLPKQAEVGESQPWWKRLWPEGRLASLAPGEPSANVGVRENPRERVASRRGGSTCPSKEIP